MEKKTNNTLLVVTILLLVVAIVFGAGLCYLSWAVNNNGNKNAASTEVFVGTAEMTETACPEGTTAPTESTVKAVLKTNPVKMEQINIASCGEYQYVQEGQVVSKKGIDVSKYQKNIDWAKVAAEGVEYAFVRVGCRGYANKGTLVLDEKFGINAKGVVDNGIKLGAYFFSQALSVEEAKEEARLVVKSLSDYDVTYPVAINIERVAGKKARQDALSVEERTEVCVAFCEYVKEAGYTPMIYGNLETFSSLIDPEQLAEYDFWISETDGKMTFPYEFAIWQYSHTGNISGISKETNMSLSLKEW